MYLVFYILIPIIIIIGKNSILYKYIIKAEVC